MTAGGWLETTMPPETEYWSTTVFLLLEKSSKHIVWRGPEANHRVQIIAIDKDNSHCTAQLKSIKKKINVNPNLWEEWDLKNLQRGVE